jgi:hypothetical protein
MTMGEAAAPRRISNICCSFLKPFLNDFNIDQCTALGLPRTAVDVPNVYDYRKNAFATRHGLVSVVARLFGCELPLGGARKVATPRLAREPTSLLLSIV